MVVERFTLDHLPVYAAWLTAHAHEVPEPSELPALGYVVGDDIGHIAMVFLRRVEGGYCQVDGLTTNPERNSEDRHQAIDLAIKSLMSDANALGAKGVVAFTKHASTIERAKTMGFQELPQTYLAVKFKR